jgi:hypothetical protein
MTNKKGCPKAPFFVDARGGDYHKMPRSTSKTATAAAKALMLIKQPSRVTPSSIRTKTRPARRSIPKESRIVQEIPHCIQVCRESQQ